MPSLKGTPVVSDPPPVRSGDKYVTPQGFTAIRDGIKARGGGADVATPRKPSWLRAPAPVGAVFQSVRALVKEHRLATVCEEAKCPNIGECWNAGTATLMLMGAVCTRACRFCAVDTGNPRGWLDAAEPANAARTVELMKLKYVVLTSVNRDDLPDGGAAHYAACVRAIKRRNPHTAVEALTPDFQGVAGGCRDGGRFRHRGVRAEHRDRAPPDTSGARSTRRLRADARRARAAKRHRPALLTKSSLMLGLGETRGGDPRHARRPACGGRGHRHARPVPASDRAPPAGGALRHAGGIRSLPRVRPWPRAFSNVSQVRWCARAIAPSRP